MLAADSLSRNAYGIYLLHYPFVIWLQYVLLGLAILAVAKGTIVFIGALALSWTMAIALRHLPLVSAAIFPGQPAAETSPNLQVPPETAVPDNR